MCKFEFNFWFVIEQSFIESLHQKPPCRSRRKLESEIAQKHNIRTEIGLVDVGRRDENKEGKSKGRRRRKCPRRPRLRRWPRRTLGKCPNPSKFSHAAPEKRKKQHEEEEVSDSSQVERMMSSALGSRPSSSAVASTGYNPAAAASASPASSASSSSAMSVAQTADLWLKIDQG